MGVSLGVSCCVGVSSLLFSSGRKWSKAAVAVFCSILRGALQHSFFNLHKEAVLLSLSRFVPGSFGLVSMHAVDITPS